MEYVKTLKQFVSGSDKLFDVFHCKVDEVDEFLDSSGRKSIKILVNDQEFKGLHNKKVFEHLVEHEGEDSFIVLWKTPKGNYLLAYKWELWESYINGDTSKDVDISVAEEAEDNHEAFVYLWIDLSNDRKYIGCHKGSFDDGYICSNELMTKEYEQRPHDFLRTILAYGSQKDMHELETLLLIQLGCAQGGMWFNLSNNLFKNRAGT